jgi:RNA polymerase sigma-70 factor, ECF subfamily
MMYMAEEVTELLIEWRNGDKTALDKLLPMVYEELRRIANRYMGKERSDHTLQTSALVNEAYMKLINHEKVNWQNRSHFFALASRAMRQILVDYARSRNYAKRGAGAQKVSLDETAILAKDRAVELVALDDALQSLAAIDLRKSQIVELRYFGGLSVEEIAEVLEISPATVTRHWNAAKVWLMRAISKDTHDDT